MADYVAANRDDEFLEDGDHLGATVFGEPPRRASMAISVHPAAGSNATSNSADVRADKTSAATNLSPEVR
ncbi:hypothetical protein IU470_31510 [Nocardia abscessus]|uniref:Uncharacterized protein n=1 Tax=Nocardia abscessus TaxID=120957 RepID=A0ABS0CMB8_9NOCA|nr:hypothetical protein [Nocardia abscessus]MBF6229603.1 hypothetical protein [Nocardia abscessus]